MNTKPSETPKKIGACRSPEMITELIFEAERKGNAAKICRRPPRGIRRQSPQIASRAESTRRPDALQQGKSSRAN